MNPSTNDVTFTTFFGRKISTAAFYTLLAGIILAVVITLFIPYGAFIGVYILLMFLLISYNVNCAQVGHCYVWAWVLTFIYLFYVSLSVVVIITNKDMWIKAFLPGMAEKLSTSTTRIAKKLTKSIK